MSVGALPFRKYRWPKRQTRKLAIVTNLPVSIGCNMHLYADGDYGRQEIEKLIKLLQQQLDLGGFDSEMASDMGSDASASCTLKADPAEVVLNAGSGPARAQPSDGDGRTL